MGVDRVERAAQDFAQWEGAVIGSRSRPRPQPDPDVRSLRALRRACDDFIVVCEAGYAALNEAAVAEGGSEFVYLKTALAVATGKRGTGGIGTPVGLRHMLSRLLGEV